MVRITRMIQWFAAAGAALSAATAGAEIVDLRGQAESTIIELRGGTETQRNEVLDAFPGTSDTLPLQVVAQVAELSDSAAAFAAAQLADPLTATGRNPGDFALSLSLNTAAPDVAYRARAAADEIRLVRLTPAELGRPAGSAATVDGRLFLDGVFAVFGEADSADLSGAEVTVRVRVEQLLDPDAYRPAADPNDPDAVVDPNAAVPLFDPNSPGDPNQPVDPNSVVVLFDGQLDVVGRADGGVDVAASGDFPTSAVLRIDLSSIAPELGAFTVVTVPNVTLDYAYTAVAGTEFALRARLEVEGVNRPDGVGVVGLMGFPITGWADVLAFTQAPALSAKMVSAIERERTEPRGTPALAAPARFLPVGACGLLGFETLAGAGLLAGLRYRRGVRPRSER